MLSNFNSYLLEKTAECRVDFFYYPLQTNPNKKEDGFRFGQEIQFDGQHTPQYQYESEVSDEVISQFFEDLCDAVAYLSPELKEYISEGFETKKEKQYRLQRLFTVLALIAAFIAPLWIVFVDVSGFTVQTMRLDEPIRFDRDQISKNNSKLISDIEGLLTSGLIATTPRQSIFLIKDELVCVRKD
ncbi:hypothetical protein [Pseudovibrio sp. WM33]|uniref:hypothetical protein n=1 Tax=Pseudovibrio sp. WM33 TaxID=1735585 RepID=UPI0007AE92CF|nr:hypothetical protein [Pseudovibrio sp. WM33]KZL23346.1 hypothetical protein PsWM33_03535 [Pseudovibrio sp. WM33]